MSQPLVRAGLVLALLSPACFGQQVPVQSSSADALAARSADTNNHGGVEVLSDTGGVDVHPYVKQILKMIYKNWVKLMPPEARRPELIQAEAAIRFRILPDGRIGAMFLDSSSHNDVISRSCWEAITSVDQFPALPAAMGSKPLDLRIHFYVNMQPR
jgi:TonB family protein